MTPIELLRTLFHYDSTLNDYQMVALIFEEYTRAMANVQPTVTFYPGTSMVPEQELANKTTIVWNPFTSNPTIKENL